MCVLQNIIRGLVLKGKISRIYKSITFATVLLLASICVFAPIWQKPEQSKAFAAEIIADEQFSQKDQNNIILSAEKVVVLSTGDDYEETSNGYLDENFAFKQDWENASPKEMQVASYTDTPNSYKFENIPSVNSNKTVVNNNSFVMLGNESYTKNNTTYYRSVAHSNSNNTLAEAILFSFGGYYAEYRDVQDPTLVTGTKINTENTGAQLQFVRVSAKRNGRDIVLPSVREYVMDGSTYQDFAYIIPQKAGFDGYYTFTVKYFYNEYQYTQEFSFYLIFKSTYTDNVASGLFEYATKPTIENYIENRNGAYRYYLGEEADGKENGQYPTLTYDYSKYKLSYTHTSNGVVTSYDWRYEELQDVYGTITGRKLVCEKTLNGETHISEMPLNTENGNINTAVLVLTEMGTYRFSYEYLYRGYKADNMPEIGLMLQSETLIIHGFELKYSKEGYAEAQMRKVDIAKPDNKIDLIVPNGYLLGTNPEADKLGVAYTINTAVEAKKVGTILSSQTEDALLSSVMEDVFVDELLKTESFAFVYEKDIAVGTQLSASGWQALQTILSASNKYQKTNQGSLWLDTTDEFVQTQEAGDNDILGSFYYYTPTLDLDEQNLPLPTEFKNQTTFNKPGYYMVFVRVKTDMVVSGKPHMFYQAFAFQYTTDTVNINVVTDEAEPQIVGSNKFTNKNVKITWAEPGTFEREIQANYYTVKNQYYDKATLLTKTANPLTSGDILGGNIAANEGASYLIELKTEGSAVAYRMFTIDRQHITGVSAYAVQEVYAEDKVYYEFATAKTGSHYEELIYSISDSFTSVYWNNKTSGANITAKYSFTPIIKSSEQAKELNPTASQVWFTTDYQLGKTVGPFDIGKANGLDNEIAFSNVIIRDGIYIYTLTDEAGNSTKFMVVIDSTESFMKVDGQMKSNEAFISGADVSIKLATHKAIPLFEEGQTELDQDLLNFIKLASSKANTFAYAQKGYFVQDGTNVLALNALFNAFNGTYYLTVQNTALSAYDDRPVIDNKLSRGEITTSNNELTMVYDNLSSSMVRTFYLKGKNQVGLDNIINSRSFVTVEINKDNSRLMAFYSNDEITKNKIPSTFTNQAGVYRLYTGNYLNDHVHATSENYVAITWLVGTGLYEVATIKYDYYSLNFDNFSDRFFYTNKLSKEGGETLYDSSKQSLNDRGLELLNVVDGKTREGLYVITRTYVGNSSDFNNANSQDKFVQTYYLIVDRNGIIETEEPNGGNISIGILNQERLFNSFVSSGLEVGTTTLPEIAEYNIYLKSNVLPATYNIPAAKYFDGTNSSMYNAGRLMVTLYFVDTERQISRDGKVLKLFDISLTELVDSATYTNGYYNINIAEFINEADRAKLVLAGNSASWLCLPGDYVVHIYDGVESGGERGAHSQIVGFRIPKANKPTDKPATPVYATGDKAVGFNGSISAIEQGETTLVTSEEFVKIELPVYDLTNYEQAQVDINYLVVNQTKDGEFSKFIDHQYNNLGGKVSLLTNSDYVINNVSEENGNNVVSRTIILPTYLRNADGTINTEALSSSLSYEITIRFRLYANNETPADKYSKCYYYFDNYASNNAVAYYETVYKVTLDREAPTDNINQLIKTDSLVHYYLEPEEQMFEKAVYENGSRVYFVNQYKKYFATEQDASTLYAFRVSPETTFIRGEDANKGVDKVYYRASDDLSALQLDMPVTNFAKYEQARVTNAAKTYSAILSGNTYYGKYVEILEVDKAGNTCQYVIFYAYEDEYNNYDNLNIALSFNLLVGTEIKDSVQMFGPEKAVEPLTVFNVSLDTAFEGDKQAKDKFYRIELKNVNTGETKFINTNATTTFDNAGLMQSIVNMFNASGQGNYTFIIRSRTSVSQTTINFYNKDEIISLTIENLVEMRGDQYVINLKGANTEKNGIVYYAKEITITQGTESTTYFCNPANGYNYYITDSQESYDIIYGLAGTYQLTMVDAFGKVSNYRFNTSGKAFYEIAFNGGHFVENNVYYTLNSVVINYDISLYDITILVNNESFNTTTGTEKYFDGTLILKIVKEEGKIELFPYYKNLGKEFKYVINFIYGTETEFTYNVVINTTTGAVNLMDTSNAKQPVEYFYNVNYSSEEVRPTKTASGTMNLSWVKITNSAFTYEYILHEMKKDGTYANYDLNNVSNYIINTASDSEGIYKFEIRIYGANGFYLANKVYAFSVQTVLNHLYYVQDESLKAVSRNEYFKIDDIAAYATKLSALGINVGSGNYPKLDLPLYISNQNLSVVVATDQDAQHDYVTIFETINEKGQRYTFTVHKIYTTTYPLYCGILKVDKSENIIGNVALEYKEIDDKDPTKTKLTTEKLSTTTNLSYFKTEAIDGVYALKLTQYITQYNADNNSVSVSALNIAKKNSLVLDVFYNDEFVETVNLKNLGEIGSYLIKGSGKYTFTIKDMAGNSHTFIMESGIKQNYVEITTLSEVVLRVNGKAPIQNAYYNGEVVINVHNPSLYDLTPSITVKATRNGAPYTPVKSQYFYTFKHFGTYRFTVMAMYKGKELSKTMVFTIINPKEAVESIDLTTIGNYKIEQVFNQNGKDITAQFIKVLNNNNVEENPDGRLLTYDEIMLKSQELGIMAGKQTFTLTYSVKDGIYPMQEVTIAFTMNNEVPRINSSIAPGKSTTKGFNITFNPGIIYEQVGEAYLYVTVNGKDTLIGRINENSAMEMSKIEILEKTHGAGDYYIKLQSSSGNIISSFKVVVKEPLNVWAIIVIVVVATAVISVTVTIIVLRNKMRIR